MKNLKIFLIDLIKSDKTEKEIENEVLKTHSSLLKIFIENSNLRMIINKKNYDQIKELFEDFINDLLRSQNKKKDRIFRE